METLKSLVQPFVAGAGSSSIVDGMKLVVIGGTVETARRVSSSAWSHFVNSFYLTAHFSEDDYPYDWLMHWLSHRPEWQRSREFETTTRTVDSPFPEAADGAEVSSSDFSNTRTRTRVVFQPTFDSTHTIFYKGHYLHITRSRHTSTGNTVLTVSVVARSHGILKDLVRTARRLYEAASVHKIQLFTADMYGGWRYSDIKHKRPLASVVLESGVKERVVADARDFLASETWYSDRGIPFRRGYLLYGIPGSGKSSLIHAIASELELDVYVLSLSAPWMSDDRLQQLLGVVPKGTMVLLEDLDAAFTRNTTREEEEAPSDSSSSSNATPSTTTFSRGRGRTKPSRASRSSNKDSSKSKKDKKKDKDRLNDVNTLSLSGLLNALDGVAASEGRLLFATTNHIERLDPALRRPGRMDVWVEFKHATRSQAEALYRNFFPCVEGPVWVDGGWVRNGKEDEKSLNDDTISKAGEAVMNDGESEIADDADLASIGLGNVEVRSLKLESDCTEEERASATSSVWSPLDSLSIGSLWSSSSSSKSSATSSKEARSIPSPTTPKVLSTGDAPSSPAVPALAVPTPTPSSSHPNELRAKTLLDAQTMNQLAATFAESLPEGEFSMAQLQGYLLKHKSQPEVAANGMADWVKSERELRVKLEQERAKAKAEREKKAKEKKEKAEREKKAKAKEAAEKEKVQNELEEKEKELQAVKKELEEQKKKAEQKEGETGTEGEKADGDGDVEEPVVVEKEDGEEEKKEEAKDEEEDEEKDEEKDENEEDDDDGDEDNVEDSDDSSESSSDEDD